MTVHSTSHFFTPPADSVHFTRLQCHSETLSVFKMNLVWVVCKLGSLLLKTKPVQQNVQPVRKKNSRFYKSALWVNENHLFGPCRCEGFIHTELESFQGFSKVKVTFEQLFMALFHFSQASPPEAARSLKLTDQVNIDRPASSSLCRGHVKSIRSH